MAQTEQVDTMAVPAVPDTPEEPLLLEAPAYLTAPGMTLGPETQETPETLDTLESIDVLPATAVSAAATTAIATTATTAPLTRPRVELFCGAELSYADINFLRLYNVLINLTPATKWHMGKDWMFTAMVYVPVTNYGYGERMNMIRLNIAALSKQLHFNSARQHFKLTGGLFARERMGFDVKWMWPVNSWLLFLAQGGATCHWALGIDTKGNKEAEFGKDWRFTGIAGVKFYISRWNTEFQLTGGRYLNEKMGAQIDMMRHFNHCTVGLYFQAHQKDDYNRYTNRTQAGGFKVIMMLPPYKKSKRKVVFRPASNFRLTYNAQSDGVSMKMYETDPEENERQYPIDVDWGAAKLP